MAVFLLRYNLLKVSPEQVKKFVSPPLSLETQFSFSFYPSHLDEKMAEDSRRCWSLQGIHSIRQGKSYTKWKQYITCTNTINTDLFLFFPFANTHQSHTKNRLSKALTGSFFTPCRTLIYYLNLTNLMTRCFLNRSTTLLAENGGNRRRRRRDGERTTYSSTQVHFITF